MLQVKKLVLLVFFFSSQVACLSTLNMPNVHLLPLAF